MKTIVVILISVVALSFSVNAQDKKVQLLFDSPELRAEVYNTILNNHELMLEFINAMKGNEHAQMMMQNSQIESVQHQGHNGDGHQNHEMMMNKAACGMKDKKSMKSSSEGMGCGSASKETTKQTETSKHIHK